MPTPTDLQFVPVPGAPGLFVASSGGVNNPRLAYYSPGVAGPLSATQSFTTQGTYLFLGAAPADNAAFADAVRRLLATPALTGAKMVWIQAPDDPLSRWLYTSMGA